MSDIYQDLLARALSAYASASRGFHPEANAKALRAAVDGLNEPFSTMSAAIAREKSGGYPSPGAYREATENALRSLGAQRNVLQAAIDAAARADQNKVRTAATLDASAKAQQAKAQQAADDALLATVDDIIKQARADAAAAQAPPTPIPPTPVPPTPIPPTPVPVRLIDLRVLGAERTSSGVWYQTYGPGRAITIQAVVDPPQGASPTGITWQGGQPDATGLPQLRAVPLGTLTPFGQPLTVQATLGSVTKSVRVMVVPNLLRFDVEGAEGLGEGKWGIDPEDTKPAVVRAVIDPPGAEAAKYLQWTGGEPCPDATDNTCRLVPAAAFKDPTFQIPIDVKINLA